MTHKATIRHTRCLSGLFVLASLSVLALVSWPAVATALEEAPGGEIRFTLYTDAYCEGTSKSWTSALDSRSHTAEWTVDTLGDFNDRASSWSLCNNSGQT